MSQNKLPLVKPTATQITNAVGAMGICRYFPAGDIERKAIMRLLSSMVGDVRQLEWLVTVMVNQVGEWQGPKELRGVFCTRFKPADGIEADCSISGFTAEDGEARFLEKQSQEQARIAQANRKLLTSGIPQEEMTESEIARQEIAALLGTANSMPDRRKAPPASSVAQRGLSGERSEKEKLHA